MWCVFKCKVYFMLVGLGMGRLIGVGYGWDSEKVAYKGRGM